jgi:hypothetical protein
MNIITNIFTVHTKKISGIKITGNRICTFRLVAMLLFNEDIHTDISERVQHTISTVNGIHSHYLKQKKWSTT